VPAPCDYIGATQPIFAASFECPFFKGRVWQQVAEQTEKIAARQVAGALGQKRKPDWRARPVGNRSRSAPRDGSPPDAWRGRGDSGQRLATADADRRGRVDRNLQCRQPLDRQPEGAISADLNRGILHMRRDQRLHHLKKRFAQKLLRLTDQQQGGVRRLVGAKIARDGAEGSNGGRRYTQSYRADP